MPPEIVDEEKVAGKDVAALAKTLNDNLTRETNFGTNLQRRKSAVKSQAWEIKTISGGGAVSEIPPR